METDDLAGHCQQFTCITCRVAFRDLDVQRLHYKSDWHRYNLKRKVAELPPISSEDFQKRVLAHKAEDDLKKQTTTTTTCKICRKNFNTKNQYENHLGSKKHRDNALKHDDKNEEEPTTTTTTSSSDTDSWTLLPPPQQLKDKKKSVPMDEDSDDAESVDSDEWRENTDNPVENNNCLFCSHHSRSWVRNLKHMTDVHSFFLPDFEYCLDHKGLIEYLGEKVYVYYMCLWCNDTGRGFHSADAARSHMIDKGHCKMLHEGEALAEYAEFYDYSSSYPDADNHDPDTEVDIPELDDGDYQLVLPSGSVIGHRSLMRYYRQSLDPNRALALPRSEKLRKVLCHYRALGWTGSEKEQIVKKARDIKYMQRIQTKYSTKLQFKANKFQTHFRAQVNF